MNVLYARNEHQGILIICPHCKMGVRHDSDDIGDAIKEAKPITCAVCEKRFTLAIFAVTEEAVEQLRALDTLCCEEEGCKEPAVMSYCETHAP